MKCSWNTVYARHTHFFLIFTIIPSLLFLCYVENTIYTCWIVCCPISISIVKSNRSWGLLFPEFSLLYESWLEFTKEKSVETDK